METVNTTTRLSHLRELMKKNKVDVYSKTNYCIPPTCLFAKDFLVVPSEDSHQSEYIAPCDGRRGRDTL